MLFVCYPKILHKHCFQFLLGVKMAPRETENNAYAKFWGDKQKGIIIQCKCFFLFIGQEPTTWPANNCLQIMVCSCAMLFNCFWLLILFCSCVNETTLFSFLWPLLRENGRSLRFPKIFLKKQTRWSNDKTIIELSYCTISWFVSVSQINYLPQLNNITDLLTTDKSRYFAITECNNC